MPIRLAIVDGHTLIRYGLRELVLQHDDLEVVADCSTAAEVTRLVTTARPDVITLGVALPDGDGLLITRELRERHPGLGIVLLTARSEDATLLQALHAGASAFVCKSAPVEELLGAIRHAAVAAASFTASGLAAALTRQRETQDGLVLSRREAEVLRLLRDGLSIPAIADTMFISRSTAKTYAARLYEKLGASNRAQALMTAVRHGLIGQGHDGASATLIPLQADRRLHAVAS